MNPEPEVPSSVRNPGSAGTLFRASSGRMPQRPNHEADIQSPNKGSMPLAARPVDLTTAIPTKPQKPPDLPLLSTRYCRKIVNREFLF